MVEKAGSPDFKQRLRDAYVAYRLNQPELQQLVSKLRQGEEPGTLQELLDRYAQRDVDWREQPADSVEDSLKFLGMDQEFAQLSPDRVWTPYERALYRRLSQPQFDPPLTPSDVAQAGEPLLMDTLERRFEDWDRNHDTRLTMDEVDRAMIDEKDPASAATLATLRRYRAGLESCYPADGAGISRSDVHIFGEQGVPGLGSYTAGVNETFQEYLERARKMTEPVPLAQEEIDPAQIHQGNSGTCVMLSTLIGTPPTQLREMLKENGDGLFTIHFADNEEEFVPELSMAERLFHSRGEGQQRWPGLLEMAMAQRLFRDVRPQDGSLRSAIDGIDPEKAMLAFTGAPANRVSLDELTLNQTRALLMKVTTRPGPVICATRPEALSDFISVEELHNGLANGHCYALLGFDPDSNRVSLQNPWHKGEWRFQSDGDNDGRFQVPLTEFYSSYRWLASPESAA